MSHPHLPQGIPPYWEEAKGYLAGVDPHLKAIFQRFEGDQDVPLRSRGDLFYTLANAIVGQQISAAAAASIWRRLLDNWGGAHPDVVAQSSIEDLRELGLSLRKAEYLIGIARAMPHLLTFPWREMTPAEVQATLMTLRGVGPWTAEMVQIFTLLHPDVLPLGDIGVIRAVERIYHQGQPLTKEQVSEIASHWSPYRTVAAWYLWRTIDAEPVEY